MNSNVIFIKIDRCQQTRDQVLTKIAQIDVMIESLYDVAIKSIDNGDVAEYKIDTGQSKQEVKYTTMESVVSAIEKYEKLRSMLQVKLTSRRTRLLPGSNFIKRR